MMNKTEMKKIIKAPFSEIIKAIKDKDVNKELKALNDLQSVCEDLKDVAEKRKQTITKGMLILTCKKCGYYFKPNPKKQYETKHIETKIVYWDPGDDHRYADFEVTDLCEKCPKCQKPVVVKLAWYEMQIPGTLR